MSQTVFTTFYDRARDGQAIVKWIDMTGTSRGRTTGDIFVLHFRIYLPLDSDGPTQRSVAFDMTPISGRRRHVSHREQKQHPDYCNRPMIQRIPVMKDVKVDELIELMKIHRMDRYIYGEGGFGCRYWCSRVLETLAIEGLVAREAEQNFLDWIREASQARPAAVPWPITRGTFY